MVRRIAAVVAVGVLSLGAVGGSGCSVFDRRPDPAPPATFTDVTVHETGGIDGRQNILGVQTDGVGLLMSGEPASGRLDNADLDRLRMLLESEQFRIEVATPHSTEPPQCSDQVTVSVVMGPLAMSRSGPCSGESDPPTPAFDEILSILADPLRGRFDKPVPPGKPALVPLHLEADARTGEPGYLITVDQAGRATISGPSTATLTLPADRVDTLRLLLARLQKAPPESACAEPGRHRLTLDGPKPVAVTECRYFFEQPELRSVVVLLSDAFDL